MKKIIFIDVAKAIKNCYDITYNNAGNALYIEYWKTDSIKSGACYSVDDTVIFSKNSDSVGEIWVRSKKYRNPPCNVIMHAPEYPLYDHISEAFKIFDYINAKCKSEGKDPVWMLEFDLDDILIGGVLRIALTKLFHSFVLSEPACDAAITNLYRDYHPSALYNMMVNNLNLTKRDHEDMLDCSSELFALLKKKKEPFHTIYRTQKIDRDWPESSLTKEGKAHYDKMFITACRGNGKTALAQRIMRDAIFGINGGLNMDNLYNFRKNIKEIRRDKKNPGKFLIDTKGGLLSREIVCDGFSKEELYSEEFIETILVIATQIPYDGITKVIFNKEEKLTIIFPNNSYNFSERIIVKANGLDTFDILNGYSIAKAKMLCSGDGYQWYNKLRKSGKVDV